MLSTILAIYFFIGGGLVWVVMLPDALEIETSDEFDLYKLAIVLFAWPALLVVAAFFPDLLKES